SVRTVTRSPAAAELAARARNVSSTLPRRATTCTGSPAFTSTGGATAGGRSASPAAITRRVTHPAPTGAPSRGGAPQCTVTVCATSASVSATPRSSRRAATASITSTPARTRRRIAPLTGSRTLSHQCPPAPVPTSSNAASSVGGGPGAAAPHSSRTASGSTSQRWAMALRTRRSNPGAGVHASTAPDASPSIPGAGASCADPPSAQARSSAAQPRNRRRHAGPRVRVRDRTIAPASAHHPIGNLGHVLARLDRLRVDLVGAQGGDHVHHLLHDLHVAGLEAALDDAPEAVFLRVSDDRGTRRGRLGEQVLAQREQAGGVREPRQLDTADLDRLRLARGLHGHDAVARDGDAHGVGWDIDPGQDGVTAV